MLLPVLPVVPKWWSPLYGEAGVSSRPYPTRTSQNALFPRLRRQLRAQILMYALYIVVLRAVLSSTHEKITIFRGTLKFSKVVGILSHILRINIH